MQRKYSSGSINISITMSADILAKLNELAEESGKSRNSIIVESIAHTLIKAGKMKAGENQ